uniref:Uncharacterized protein n=1 Tax=Oryza barthii TaxID=65489 RepID=A0A0D3G7G7_9ORYZ
MAALAGAAATSASAAAATSATVVAAERIRLSAGVWRPDPSPAAAERPDLWPATAGRPDPSLAAAGRLDPWPATVERPDPVAGDRGDDGGGHRGKVATMTMVAATTAVGF